MIAPMRGGYLGLSALTVGLVAAAGPPTWVVRDVETGAAVPALLEFWAGEPPAGLGRHALEQHLKRAADRRWSSPAAPFAAPWQERGVLRIQAEGHAPLIARLEPGALGMTFWLEPRTAPAASEPWPPGELVVEGFVRDHKSLMAIAGAGIRIEPLGWEAVSDVSGFYRLQGLLPDPPAEPAFLTILLRPDHRSPWRAVERSLPWVPGKAWRIIHDDEYAARPSHRLFALPEELSAQRPPASAEGLSPLAADDPPASIRVGFNDAGCTQTCCGTGCSHVCVFPLETYVRRGITHEWIASWHPHSLRAGTVAYRGYGAWRVAVPITGSYDICSSACCQVNGATIHANGQAAVARTRGIIMLRNGLRFAAEYSAENNCLLGSSSCSNPDLSCGNGFNGSPANGWPCLADPVGLDRACFGHGRGMSQWGSQRWAIHATTPRPWPWIVDHYYNANGQGSQQRTAVMSRVLAIESVGVQPSAVMPGQGFTISLQARNRAAEPHERVLIGASIRLGSGPWLSDPANDRAVVLASGLSTQERPFLVPVGTPPGSYRLAVALFLDIDEDQALASTDLLQARVELPDALTVLPLAAEIFRDGFE